MAGEEWKPRPDQQAVLDWLDGRSRGAVWAAPGTGKTAVAGWWLDQVLFERNEADRALIVAPPLVAERGWPEQAARWAHMQRIRAAMLQVTFRDLDLTRTPEGPLDFRDKAATKRRLAALPGRVHVCSWHALPWLAKAWGKRWPYQVLVLDEASFAKDQSSDRGKACRHVVHRTGVVTHMLELTATPNANHDEAVYSQLDLVQKGLLGTSLTDFREVFCAPDARNWQTGQVYSWKLRAGMRAEFQRRCATVAVSVPDNLGIETLTVEHWHDPTDEVRAAHRAMLKDGVWRGIVAGSEAVRASKAMQLASGFVYPDPVDIEKNPVVLSDDKVRTLAEMIESAERPVLVAYNFLAELAALRSALGKHVADVHDRGAIDRFLAGKLKVLALHPASAGHGLDGLQRATNQMVWMSVPVDAELFTQATGRLRRAGQDEATVMVHLLLTRDTREEDVWREMLPRKRANAALLQQATMLAS